MILFSFFFKFYLFADVEDNFAVSQTESQTQTDLWSYTIITPLHQNQNFFVRQIVIPHRSLFYFENAFVGLPFLGDLNSLLGCPEERTILFIIKECKSHSIF